MKVTIFDNKAGEKCSNGGEYGFTREFNSLPDGNYELSYFTTADFPYCSKCGNFYQGEECSFCNEEYETFTEKEVIDFCEELIKQQEYKLDEVIEGSEEINIYSSDF